MKKEEIPQDPGALNKVTKEVSYAVDENGHYVTGLSTGWEVKINALDVAWRDIEKKVKEADQKVRSGEASPLLLFMELNIMDIHILSAYTGFWKWQIRRHLKPAVFRKLSDKKLQRYAEAFEVSVKALKTGKPNDRGV